MTTTPKNLVKVGRLTPTQLVNLAITVAARMTGNAYYTTPSPTMIQLGTDITALSDAIVARGSKRNKGTAEATSNLATAVALVRQDLIALANYVMTTTPYDRDALITTGFAIKFKKHISKKLQTVRNATAKMVRSTNQDETKFQWKFPLGTHGKVITNRMYTIRYNTVPIYGTSKVLTQTTKSKITISSLSLTGFPFANGAPVYYWIVGQNGKGESVVSNVMTGRFVDLGA